MSLAAWISNRVKQSDFANAEASSDNACVLSEKAAVSVSVLKHCLWCEYNERGSE